MQFLKTEEQIKKEIRKLNPTRDDLIEWLLKNTEEDWPCRVYITEHAILVHVDKLPTLDK